jgi:hypothetical protein
MQAIGSEQGILVFLVVIALIVARRIYRGLYGGKYRRWRTFFLPALYLVLTLLLALVNPSVFPHYVDALLFLLIVLGVLSGLRFGENVKFYMNNGVLYYKRSPYVLMFWAALYILRLSIEFLLPTTIVYSAILDAALAFSAGLLLGEAFHIVNEKKRFLENQSPGSAQSPL